ncbi:hypothetical protein POM88_035786 [Heracleum sosnowskyi]|uniref:Reverse transcriptase zinc-binding domain-containing protein n=1 Tax=Heracleum sosnowskyi TaxID=360622 RepID=A0AAD8MEE3_9APIA|nr:hypothetical protein POM88_035786 [Heracleum sosnowskyi]
MEINRQCSWCLKKILKARTMAVSYIRYQVGRDSSFDFWHDPWVNNKPLLAQFPRGIISILDSFPEAKASYHISAGHWHVSYSNHVDAMAVRALLSLVPIHDTDSIHWGNCKACRLSISEIQNTIRTPSVRPGWYNVVWPKTVVPKFSCLLWLVMKQRLLTRDRMVRFHMNVPQHCVLCVHGIESHAHLFSECPYTRIIMQHSPCPITRSWMEFSLGNVTAQTVSNTEKQVTYLFIAAACHAIWKERNARVHQTAHAFSAHVLANLVKRNVREKLLTCTALLHSIRLDPRLEAIVLH